MHDGVGLAALVADGRVSASELLAAARDRARLVAPRVNAIVRWMDDDADVRAAEPLNGPFAGVPFLLKDLYQEYAGVSSAGGCRALAHLPATANATVVERWLGAGLVIFGKTNTPEFGAKAVTEAELYGPARNPWHLDHTPAARAVAPRRPSPLGSCRLLARATAAARSAYRPRAAGSSASRPAAG